MAATAPPPPPSLLFFNGLLILAFLSIPFIALRILFLLPPLRPPPRPRRRPGGPSTLEQKDSTANPLLTSSSSDASPAEPTRLLVVLGSGGHTAEMLAMLRKLDARTFLRSWSTRTYVISEGDSLSAERAREFEESLLLLHLGLGADQKDTGAEGKRDDEDGVGGVGAAPVVDAGTYALHAVPRARRVHQPLLTTPLSALRCLRACVAIVRAPRPPDLVLTNGPGTAVVVVLTALLLRFLDVGDAARTSRVRTVYVESWARVRRLSLSGRLLLRVVDRFLVQWEGLVEKTGGRGEFLGVLV